MARDILAEIEETQRDILAPQDVDYQKQVIEEMGVPERTLAGIGRGFTTTGQGLKQLGMEIGESVGLVDPEETEAYRQQIAEEKRLYEPLEEESIAAKGGDVLGTIIATAPTMLVPGGAAPQLTTRMMSAAGGGALGATAQPVYEGDFVEEKLGQAKEGALFGAGATWGLDKLREFMPRNLMAKLSKKVFDEGSLMTKQGNLLSNLTGIDMTPAQVSGSKTLTFLENAARQSMFTADKVAKKDQKVIGQAVNRITKLAEKVAKSPRGRETVGAEIQDATKDAIKSATDLRRAVAQADYGAAETAAGGQKVMRKNNFVQELNDIISEYGGRSADDAKAVVKKAQVLLDEAKGKPFKVNDVVGDRSFYGKAAQGTGNIVKDVDKKLNRLIANRLHKALTRDMIDGERIPEIGALLRTANDNYAANSQSIKALQKTPLGRLVGEDLMDEADIFGAGGFNTTSGEKVVKKIKSLDPSEIRTTVKILDNVNPETANQLRARVLLDALEDARTPPAAGSTKEGMSFNKFLSNLNKSKWKSFGYKPQEIKDINRTMRALERVGDRSGYNWSGTQVQAGVMDNLQALGELATGQMQKAAATGLQFLGLNRISNAMMTPEGRKALMTLSKPQLRRNELEKAITVIENIGVTGMGAELAEQE